MQNGPINLLMNKQYILCVERIRNQFVGIILVFVSELCHLQIFQVCHWCRCAPRHSIVGRSFK